MLEKLFKFYSTVVRGKILKKILYITYDGLADKLGHSQIIPYLLNLNKIDKYNFTIISFEKNSHLTLLSSL